MTTDIEFVRSVLALGDGFNHYGNLWESIWWRTDDEYAPVTFMVNCSDLFLWACADCERLTPENLPLLTQAVRDVRTAQGAPPDDLPRGKEHDHLFDVWYDAGSLGAHLFCARVRGMRPQQPCYRDWVSEVKALFDACGPVRDRKSEG